MTTYTFGEVSWESAASAPSGKKGKSNIDFKDMYITLAKGDNDVRVVTQPFQYLMHKYKAPGDKGFGRKVVCSGEADCPLCKAGDKNKKKWYFGVIDRKDDKYRIMDVSYSVFSKIVELVKNKKWGDVTKYDVTITVNPDGGATNYYNVVPDPASKSPTLSAKDQLIVDNIDKSQLEKLSTPPTNEAVQKKIDYIHSQLNIPAGTAPVVSASADASAAPKKKAKVIVPVAEEEFESFEEAD